MRPRCTVHVVEDDPDVRKAVADVLVNEGFKVFSYGSAQAFLNGAGKDAPACLITDFSMPEMDGLALLQEMQRAKVVMPAIVMTGYADVPLAVTAMKAGAVDFIEKPFDNETLLDAIETAMLRAARPDDQRFIRMKPPVDLTPREQQVLAGLVDGLTNKMIAFKLGISPRTVEIHRTNLMLKMRAKNLPQLLRLVAIPAAS